MGRFVLTETNRAVGPGGDGTASNQGRKLYPLHVETGRTHVDGCRSNGLFKRFRFAVEGDVGDPIARDDGAIVAAG